MWMLDREMLVIKRMKQTWEKSQVVPTLSAQLNYSSAYGFYIWGNWTDLIRIEKELEQAHCLNKQENYREESKWQSWNDKKKDKLLPPMKLLSISTLGVPRRIGLYISLFIYWILFFSFCLSYTAMCHENNTPAGLSMVVVASCREDDFH